LPDAEGWVTVTLPIESIDHATAMLLRLGADAEILAPAGLRQAISETVTALAAIYAVPARLDLERAPASTVGYEAAPAAE
jgi:predicted DNA-binding transcriptional regulator YafY